MTCLAAYTDRAVLAMYNTGTTEQRTAARAELFKRAILGTMSQEVVDKIRNMVVDDLAKRAADAEARLEVALRRNDALTRRVMALEGAQAKKPECVRWQSPSGGPPSPLAIKIARDGTLGEFQAASSLTNEERALLSDPDQEQLEAARARLFCHLEQLLKVEHHYNRQALAHVTTVRLVVGQIEDK